jgi:high-affinity nickel permease
MLSVLVLALFVGMHHATEADHVAAVSSLVSGKKRFSDVIAQGATWGLGHTLTLFVFAGAALIFGWSIPDQLATTLEGAVGVMLVGLGLHVLYRLWRDRIHFHTHTHTDGPRHFHAHSHKGEMLRHEWSPHGHAHKFNWRTLLVGMTHGMAGSAALLVITVSQAPSALQGLLYIIVFGLGSMVGMAMVSAAISIPLLQSAKYFTYANRFMQGSFGVVTIAIGANIIRQAAVSFGVTLF